MSRAPSLPSPAGAGLPAAAAAPPIDRDAVAAAAAEACSRIAPMWPLRTFVAVNPFLGFSARSFAATCATMHRVARVEILMPREFYRNAYASGRIEARDLLEAASAAPADWRAPQRLEELEAALSRPGSKAKHAAVVATVAEVLDSLADGDREVSGTRFMIDEISRWCAAYFDQGQSSWRLPARAKSPYAAWRASVRFDRNPEVMGVENFRALVAEFPDDPIEAIGEVVARQGIPKRATVDYLHQALLDVAGWAAYARYLVWNSELYGHSDDTLLELLAIRVVWGYTLFVRRRDPAFTTAWKRAMEEAALPPIDDRLGDDPELCIDLVLHSAYERAFRRRLLEQLESSSARSAPSGTRPAAQAAFCIDVRSEVYRRALERAYPELETIGFAGFFGFPIEYVPIGNERGGAQCPVLLTPAFVVCESVAGASDDEDAEILGLRVLRRRAAKAWKSFKTAAVSSFIFVETAGILFAAKIVGDSLALTRTVNDPNTDGLDKSVIGRLAPRIEPRTVGGRQTGFDLVRGVQQAEATLRGMSLTTNFARVVLLCGHGSTTVNNPHASGLDCGACGGHTGEANARVAASILNDRAIRAGLRERGIAIPDDTWFLGALHDTTTDAMRIFEDGEVPATHRGDLDRLRRALAEATSQTRLERSPRLGLPVGSLPETEIERRLVARSRDWAQVRPEWGLAGNASFFAAPRSRTRGLDLDGRAFLHDYDWRRDEGFGVLELIMTAPMVVAVWINLQYYGSTVNNRVFGCGNKALHNVSGTIGVLEGNAGDLRAGLPMQSVHDGTRFVHEPMRLSVFIEAPTDAIDAVIAKHLSVRELVENEWLHLFALDDDGRPLQRGKDGWLRRP